jgi:hypothetical protein
MNSNFLLMSLLLLSLSPLTAQSAQSEYCAKGNLKTTDYQLRENDGNRRCEGIQRRQIGRSLELVSLTVGRLQESNPLMLKIHGSQKNQPKVVVRHPAKNYQLDNLTLTYGNDFFQMQWSDAVLKMAGISANSLFATAEILPSGTNTSPIRIPVILNSKDGKYEFIFQCSECEVKIKTFKISNAKNQGMKCENNIGDSRSPRFFCDGRNAPQDKYRLHVSYDIKLSDSSNYESSAPIVTEFKHDPKWLK